MAIRNIRKNLAGMEDLLQGVGAEEQARGDSTYVIGKVDVPYAVDSVLAMQELDITLFTRARVYDSTLAYTDYIYDPDDTTGILPAEGAGSWRPAPKEMVFESVAEAKLASPAVGALVRTKGYYTAGDGGGATYLVAANQAVDGYGSHLLANGTVALLHSDGVVSFKQFGAKLDGVTVDTASIQACIDSGLDIKELGGTALLDATVRVTLGVNIESSLPLLFTFAAPSTDYLLTIDAISTSSDDYFKKYSYFKNLHFSNTNCVDANPVLTTELDLKPQKGITFKDCVFEGTYDINTDPNAGSEGNLPTKTDMVNLGVGLKSNKIYGLKVEGGQITGFGIGQYSNGDVAGQSTLTRIGANAVNIWRDTADSSGFAPFGTDYTFGPSLDILKSGREGSITITGTRDDKVFGCYFENKDEVTPSMVWRLEGDQGTKITQNHISPIGKSTSNHVIARFNGNYQTIVADNRIQDYPLSLSPAYSIDWIDGFYGTYSATRAVFSNNMQFPEVDAPHVINNNYIENVFAYNNLDSTPNYLGGTITDNDDIFVTSANVGSYILNQSNLSGDPSVNCIFEIKAENKVGADVVELELTGGYGNGFVNLKDSSGNTLFSANGLQGFGSSFGTKKIYVDLTVTNVASETFTVTLTPSAAEWARVECNFAFRTYGTTAQRPSALTVGAGFSYMDTDIDRLLTSDGYQWRFGDGAIA